MEKHAGRKESFFERAINWFMRGKTAIWWALAFFILASHGAGLAIYEWFKTLQHHGAAGLLTLPVDIAGVSYVAAFVLALLWFRIVWRKYQPVRTLRQRHGADPQPVVILMVSRPEFESLYIGEEKIFDAISGHRTGKVVYSGELATDTASKPNRGNWQQMLRGLRPHHDSRGQKLRRIYLVGSKDKDKGNYGSFQYLYRCEAFLKRYFPDTEIDSKTAKAAGESGIDFEHLDDMRESIKCCVEHAKKEYTENQVVVDVTGGQKTTSIAACLETLTRDTEFQYVQTGGDNEIVRYNVVSEAPPRPG